MSGPLRGAVRSIRRTLLSWVWIGAVVIPASVAAETAVVSCRQCHGEEIRAERSRPVSAARARSVVVSSGEVGVRHCVACHRGGASLEKISAGHRAAAHYYHHAGESLTDQLAEAPCMACHGGPSLPEIDRLREELPEAPPRFHLEATHPMEEWSAAGVRTTGYALRPVPDTRLPLVGGRVSCVSCHDLASNEEFALAAMGGRNELCLGCHVRASASSTLDLAQDDLYFR